MIYHKMKTLLHLIKLTMLEINLER